MGPPPPATGGPRQGEEPLFEAESDGAMDDMDEELGAFESPAEELPAAAPKPKRAVPKPRRKKRERSLRQSVTDGVRDVFALGDLRGTILISEDERLVVSITAAGPLRWEPLSVVLELEDGSEIEVQLIAELTTRPIDATEGQVLRLALRWTGGALAAAPRRIRVTGPNGDLNIAV
jgi:hypothetical protein